MELAAHTNAVLLACCHGFAVAAGDELVGVVETPVFSGTALGPDSLIVRTVEGIPGTFADVPVAHVARVDDARRSITLNGSREDLFGDGATDSPAASG